METYNPEPIDLTEVELPEELKELREAIAENAHEVYGQQTAKPMAGTTEQNETTSKKSIPAWWRMTVCRKERKNTTDRWQNKPSNLSSNSDMI